MSDSEALKKLKEEHHKTIKMFIERDIRLRETAERLEQERNETHKTIKMLVQRDMQLRQTNERLEAMDREKSQFISIAAHQLRTPITAIKWIAQLLQQGAQKGAATAQKEQITKLNQIVGKVVALVGDILNVSRIEEGRFGAAAKPGDLAELLADVLKTAEITAQAKNVRIETRFHSARVPMEFDPEKLRLALTNIINNAVKYTPARGTVTVSTALGADRRSVAITVRDTGIGIPEEDQGRLFDKFYRGKNALKLETEGTGLGLFIAHNIIEAHRGAIAFTSTEGQGTAFTITLPLAKTP